MNIAKKAKRVIKLMDGEIISDEEVVPNEV